MKNKKLLVSIIIFLAIIFSFVGMVNANEEVTDRQIAIACKMVAGKVQKGRTVKEEMGEGNKIVNGYADYHELDDWTIIDFSDNQLANLGMTALVLEKDGNVIIAFRGTDTEYLEDGIINGLLNFHPQEIPSNSYVKKIVQNYAKKQGNYKIYVTGHSLGGYIAQTAGATIAEEAKKYDNIEIAKIYSFDGIGINFLTFFGNLGWGLHVSTLNTLKELAEQNKVIHYYVYGDIISAAGLHYGEMRSVYPSIDAIEERRSKYELLNLVESVVPVSTGLGIFMENALNAFKTDINKARKLYDINSMVAYINLTHVSWEFAALEYQDGIHPVSLKISQKDGLSKYSDLKSDNITINGSTTLRATTSFASAKKYVWYESDDKENWKVIKTSDLYNPDEYKPTNTITIDVEKGKTKYYKVEAYYDGNYTSRRLYQNKLLQYDYKETDESKVEEPGMSFKIIEVKGEGTASSKINILSKVKETLKKRSLVSMFLNKTSNTKK